MTPSWIFPRSWLFCCSLVVLNQYQYYLWVVTYYHWVILPQIEFHFFWAKFKMFSLCVSSSLIFLIFQVIKGVGSILIMVDSCKSCFWIGYTVAKTITQLSLYLKPLLRHDWKKETSLKSTVHFWIFIRMQVMHTLVVQILQRWKSFLWQTKFPHRAASPRNYKDSSPHFSTQTRVSQDMLKS